MAASQLFDLSGIDLNAVALPPDEVGRLNPQTGAMRHLDHVIWVKEDVGQLLGVKHVRDDEFWVPGHIPGRPILPGVIMVEAAAQLCSVMYLKKHPPRGFLGFTRMDDVVFRGQVVPGDTLYLLAEEVSNRPRRFVCRTQGVVNGAMVFEAKITGMPIG